MPSVVITGGCGFLGAALAQRIAAMGFHLPNGQHVSDADIVLLDTSFVHDPCIDGARFVPCDISDPEALDAAIPDDTILAYHLAAIVSGQAEADFNLGMQVNVDGTRALLSVLQQKCPGIPVVGTSSLAVYGADAKAPLTEDTATHPTNTYGMTKAIGELLFADYRRKGWLETRVLRLPTITVRPGKPNAAASSFVSSIIREPLAGERAICPVDPSLALWVASPATAVAALYHAPSVTSTKWPAFGAVNVPGQTVTVAEMLAALGQAAPGALDLIDMQPDESIARIVGQWPSEFDCALAKSLGFALEQGLNDIIAQAMC